ncbi:glycogen-binding subunit 76A isoform X2 [Folsomia candida]|uniref:Glycogen-binding subunit 76A n=1 Tax=Folsomia candida TaxID=158441 RepID=A0A226EN29_FOLCA|nr:glycogen-binding subunit 76A isoform X2 [Folsomia candida]OXA58434.1 Glycogen-binding subunit 76A [Folsomia candida]
MMIMFPDYNTVPNTDRLTFRGLASNHHYILQNRIYSHAPTSPSDGKMSPTTTHNSNGTNGLKVVETSSSDVGLHSPCGDGDLCEWGWGMNTLSLHAPTTTEPHTMEWFSPQDHHSSNGVVMTPLTKVKPPPTEQPPTPTTLKLNNCSNKNDVEVLHKLNGEDKSHPSEQNQSNKSLQLNRPSSLEFLNQNGNSNDDANSHNNNFNVDQDDDATTIAEPDTNNKRLRSSSLKTNKTPPGTPGHKKIVRFADCLGLDLVDVKLFLDEIPNVPKSAFSDLQDAIDQREEDFVQKRNKVNKLDRTLLPSFHQPVEMGDFFDRVDSQKVLLENCYLTDSHQIKGCVRVKNLDFNKAVFLRYTYNDWDSFEEIPATYVPGSCDGFSDRFEFNLTVDSSRTRIGCKFAFACRYECLKNEFWDNNCGRNYVFHCVPAN